MKQHPCNRCFQHKDFLSRVMSGGKIIDVCDDCQVKQTATRTETKYLFKENPPNFIKAKRAVMR